MPLPTLEAPTYKAKLLSTGKEIDYRPFLVKEEKILLIAQESGDQKQIIQAVKDLLRACTFEKLDINSITMFDLEYLFLLIRSKSVGENISYGCKCKKCEEKIEVEFSLESIEVKKPTAKKKVIQRFNSLTPLVLHFVTQGWEMCSLRILLTLPLVNK